MTGRRPRKPAPAVPGRLLDWTDSSHWARVQAPCRYCGAPTFLRDDQKRPADKVCAERDVEARAARAGAAYESGRLG